MMVRFCDRCRRPLRQKRGRMHTRCTLRPEVADDILDDLRAFFPVTIERLARDFAVPVAQMSLALQMAERRRRVRARAA